MLLRKLCFWLFCASSLVYIALFFVHLPLPDPGEVVEVVKTMDPIQLETAADPIKLDLKGHDYTINPEYSYELYGLVVSLYDAENWMDFAHTEDPGQVKDICVVWGKNITGGAYKKVKYHSGEFTCFYQWDRPLDPPFEGTQLSNNHLLPADSVIKRAIKDARIGDQIHIKGYLANYSVSKDGQLLFSRGTSTTRLDTGNGACEVIYVTSFDFLKKQNRVLYYTQLGALITVIVSGIVGGVLFLTRYGTQTD